MTPMAARRGPPKKVNLTAAFASFAERWSPKIAGEVNDTLIKLVKLQGDFVWHKHDVEDELFLVTKGRMQTDDGLTQRCRNYISGVRSMYVSEPLPKAPMVVPISWVK